MLRAHPPEPRLDDELISTCQPVQDHVRQRRAPASAGNRDVDRQRQPGTGGVARELQRRQISKSTAAVVQARPPGPLQRGHQPVALLAEDTVREPVDHPTPEQPLEVVAGDSDCRELLPRRHPRLERQPGADDVRVVRRGLALRSGHAPTLQAIRPGCTRPPAPLWKAMWCVSGALVAPRAHQTAPQTETSGVGGLVGGRLGIRRCTA